MHKAHVEVFKNQWALAADKGSYRGKQISLQIVLIGEIQTERGVVYGVLSIRAKVEIVEQTEQTLLSSNLEFEFGNYEFTDGATKKNGYSRQQRWKWPDWLGKTAGYEET